MSDLTPPLQDTVSAGTSFDLDTEMGQKIRLLSYNVQAGIRTHRYRHYFTHSWKHVLPHAQRFHNLDRVAQLVRGYDIVGLQELDAGSIRSGYVNLTEYLSEKSGMPFWYDQTNRRIGRLARHSTGLLSRYHPAEIVEHRLPGRIPGRGVMFIRYGTQQESLVVLILHLALGRRTRMMQFDYISEIVNEYRHETIPLDAFAGFIPAPVGIDGVARPSHHDAAGLLQILLDLVGEAGACDQMPVPPQRPALCLENFHQRFDALAVL